MELLEVHPLEIGPALSAVAEPGVEYLDVVRRHAVAGDQVVALRPAGLVDQTRCQGPEFVVEHGFMKGRQDALEQVLFAHEAAPSEDAMRHPVPVVAAAGFALARPPFVPAVAGTVPRGACPAPGIPLAGGALNAGRAAP